MSKKSKAKLDKKKRRERRVRLERNLRRGLPEPRSDEFVGDLDLVAALEELPDEVHFERIQRRIVRTTGKRTFVSRAEALAEFGRLSPDGSLVGTPERPDSREDAQDLAFLAADPANADSMDELLGQALELDPDCVDAASLRVMREAPDPPSTVIGLEVVVAKAEHVLGGPEFLAANRGSLWDDVMAHPYVRARRALAQALLACGRTAEATAHFDALLDLAPGSPLDLADYALGLALERGELERARELVALSHRSDSPVARWGGALERWLAGDRVRAADLVRVAHRDNDMVSLEIQRPGWIESLRVRGSRDYPLHTLGAAEYIAQRIGAAWRAHPEAMEWLADGAGATTRAEREAVCAVFTPPVSALLALGGEGLDDDWIDYPTRFDLDASHVPELLRMATDPAMHELDHKDPRECAAVHAWRALGTLRASESVTPLLALANRLSDEDVLHEDLHPLLSLIGAAAFDPLLAALADFDPGTPARAIAIESLGLVSADDPGLRSRAMAALAEILERCEDNDPELNGQVIAALIDLRAVELAPQIRSAFERDLVDEIVTGDWRSVAKELGVPGRTLSNDSRGAGDTD